MCRYHPLPCLILVLKPSFDVTTAQEDQGAKSRQHCADEAISAEIVDGALVLCLYILYSSFGAVCLPETRAGTSITKPVFSRRASLAV